MKDMKKTIKAILVLVAVAAMSSCSSGDKYSITATFTQPLVEGDAVVLIDYYTGDTLASTRIVNNSFNLEGVVETPTIAKVRVGSQGTLLLALESGEMIVDTETLAVLGTPLNAILNALGEEENAIDPDAESSVAAELYKKYYEANRDNVVGCYAFCNYLLYADLDYQQTLAAVSAAPAEWADNPRVERFVEFSQKADATKVGSKFTDFEIEQTDGSVLKLSDYVGRDGNYLLVDFWASWCPPCRREIGSTLKNIYGKYNGKGLQILGVAVRDRVEDTERAVVDLEIPWEILPNAQGIPASIYGFMGIPHVMILSPDGTILSRGLYGEALEAKVDEIMSQTAEQLAQK